MSAMHCVICKRGPTTKPSATLFRINAKGVPGLWACSKHLKQTDAPTLDPGLVELTRILEGGKS